MLNKLSFLTADGILLLDDYPTALYLVMWRVILFIVWLLTVFAVLVSLLGAL